MDALTYLRADHQAVLGMLEVLEGAPEGTGAADSGLATMVSNLIIAESQHEAIEEQWFWPAVRRALDNGDVLADHAVAQEQEGKVLLQRLLAGSPGEPDYHAALREFIAAARAHIAFEQDVVWPAFEAAVSRAELDTLGRRLAVARKVAPTRPHPMTPPNALVQKTLGMPVAMLDHVRDAVSGRSADVPPGPQVR